MPSKSQHGKKKRFPQDKKGKGKQSPLDVVAPQQAATQTYKPVAPPKVTAPLASTPTRVPVMTAVRYPYILTELQRIGILAGIMLVILVVLALVLS